MLGLTAYALFRFGVEFFRQEPTVLAGLTLSQMISLGLIGVGATLLARQAKKVSTATTTTVAKAKETVKKPADEFKRNMLEILALSPILWYAQPFVAVYVLLVNIIRAGRSGYKYLKSRSA